MKYFILSLLLLSGCTLRIPTEELAFGDRALAVSGEFKGSSIQVLHQMNDRYMQPCKVHQYYVKATKNKLTTEAYVCHEDLRVN